MQDVTFEIDYQAGAAPAVTWERGGSPFDVFEANLEAMFAVHPRPLSIPRVLDEMERIEVAADRFTAQDVASIAERHRDTSDARRHRAFYVVFLDGLFVRDAGDVAPEVVGISSLDLGFVAVFEPPARVEGLRAVIEQTTLVHEFGHIAGLVNAGIPMVEDHEDGAHRLHCTNHECIMHWLNEGPVEYRSQTHRYSLDDGLVVLGDLCLADLHTAAGAGP